MEIQTQAKPLTAEVDAQDVFVLVLTPANLLDAEICGRTVSGWIEKTIAVFTHRRVIIQKNDDIMTIVKNNIIQKKYCAVIYADTPLLTRTTLEQAISFMALYGHKAVKLPRGWIFDTEYIKDCKNVEAVQVPNLPDEDFIVVYSYSQAALVNTYVRTRINNDHMISGVQIRDPYNVYIDADVQIGRGTKIGANVVLKGTTKIGINCTVANGVVIEDSAVGDGTVIKNNVCICGAGVGSNCTIGSGVVFTDDNGKEKNAVTVGSGVFIGCNSSLVAPLTVGDNAYIAAGSTITQDLPPASLGIARARQAIKENWHSDEN
jgi:bifunctional N-acetylglucosamine-1-phosphate-uridyltransferase/glucosamine-1-phosphate-acetyltransferase GlmU-like protein